MSLLSTSFLLLDFQQNKDLTQITGYILKEYYGVFDYKLGTFSDPVYSFQMMKLLVPHMESLLQVYEGSIL